tara:strand:- start:15116 stop:15439 length:324 start_codon:yes stop_codon:yes gene_type:complete
MGDERLKPDFKSKEKWDLRQYLLDTVQERMDRRRALFNKPHHRETIFGSCHACGTVFSHGGGSGGNWLIADGQNDYEVLSAAEVAAFLEMFCGHDADCQNSGKEGAG